MNISRVITLELICVQGGAMKRFQKYYSIGIIGTHLISICMFFNSCAGIRGLAESAGVQEPQVDIVGAKVTGLSFQNADLMFDIRIDNPNPVGIKLAGFDYDFLINDNTFVNGDQHEGIEIKAQGEHTVHLPLSVEFSSLYNAFQSLRERDTSSYQLNCGFSFDVPILGLVRIPVSTKGDLPLLKFPQVSLDKLSLKNLGLTGADLELSVRLNNPNAFSMLLERFNYQFLVNGQPWASGDASHTVELVKKGESLLLIPISLNFLQVGQSVYEMLTGDEELNYNFTGDFYVTSTLPLFKKANLDFDRSGLTELIR